MDAEERAELLAAQLEEQAMQLPDLEDALRQAQTRASEQRASVVQVQQQIGVLAAEQRSLDEQSRQLDTRYERLRADRNALAAPDEARLNNLRSQLEAAQEQAETTEARLAELQDTVPQLDEDRRARQQDVNTESARQTDLSARMEALKALQEKVKTDGKLRPWLAKHGLDGMQGLWSRIHIEPGWENALEAACANAWARWKWGAWTWCAAFWARTKTMRRLRVWLSTAPLLPGVPEPTGAHTRLADLLRIHDASLRAVLTDWLQGCSIAQTLDEALNRRASLQPGEVIYVPTGHAVSSHSVSFYAQDSEQSGLLARAQRLSTSKRTARPGADCRRIAHRAGPRRSGLCRRLAAPGGRPPRSHRGPKPRPRAAGGNPAPDPVGRADPCAQRAD